MPEEIRQALHISEGDEVEFTVLDDGIVTVRGYVSVPSDQYWVFTSKQQANEPQTGEGIAAVRLREIPTLLKLPITGEW